MKLAPPLELFLKNALSDFERALVQRNVYDEGHENLKRACNGAQDFARFLLEGPGRSSAAPAPAPQIKLRHYRSVHSSPRREGSAGARFTVIRSDGKGKPA